MKKLTRRRILYAAAGFEILLAVAAARTIDRAEAFPLYLAGYFGMAVAWIGASYAACHEPGARRSDRFFVLGVALVLRALFLPTEPRLSDDVFRYVWDGRVQKAGINPYRYAPADPALAPLRDELFVSINNKAIPTIYPPLSQAAFLLATSIFESVLWMKAFFVLFDLALVWTLWALLEALGMNPLRAVVYAFSPLAVVEIAGSGHNDVLAVLFLFAALLAFERRRDHRSVLLLTASGLAKLGGFALAPLFVRFVKPRALLVLPVASALVLLPYAPAGTLALRGLSEYGARWRGNDSLFHLLYALTGSLTVSKIVVAGMLAIFVLILVWKKTPPPRACYWTLGATLLLAPTVHPWYLLWVAPFLALYPNPAWMFLTASVALSYHAGYLASAGAPWEEVLWLKALEYVPFFALLGLDWLLHEPRAFARGPVGRRAG